MLSLPDLPDYPLTRLRDDFFAALDEPILLLEAEPGAGKSTLAPLWVLSRQAMGSRVLLLQPRVLAAQALAQRLAELLGEQPGQTVGYQVPYDNCSSEATRLLVMTPGILLQYMLQNPSLDGVGCVMLDEAHERSVNQDTAWAWLQESQILRDDLRLIVMSATPDPQLQQQIDRRLFTPGRCFPVTTDYCPPKNTPTQSERLEDHVLRALVSIPDFVQTTALVFLPGWAEIERCAQAVNVRYPGHCVFRLHSRVPAAEQRQALDPAQGPRLILSTNIAETSLTIADVTLVIDSGLMRRADYEQRTGLTRLRVSRISQASADQRRGRAGRVQAGHCIRLWSQDQPLAPADLPEIRTTDYLPLALRLAHWGSPAADLPWLESPNSLALTFAQEALQQMGLLDTPAKITSAGERVSMLGCHPRVAALLLAHEGDIAEETLLLALCLHFDSAPEGDLDAVLDFARGELKHNRQWRVQQQRWLQRLSLKINPGQTLNTAALARAYSDRIGYRQASGRYRLNSGISVEPLGKVAGDWAVFPLITARAKGHSGTAIAIALTSQEQRSFSQHQQHLEFKNKSWHAREQWLMGGVIIDECWTPLRGEALAEALITDIRQRAQERGLESLDWDDGARLLLARARLVAREKLLPLPSLSDTDLVQSLETWLAPFLNEQTQWETLPWRQGLEFYLGYEQCQSLAQLLPDKIVLPSGRQVLVEFSAEGVPQIAAKLQEFFGCEQLQLAGGRLPLKIHLLSPNGSPLAITMNLQTFWQQAYPDVRKEMRGRYPRHPWPEDPLTHQATALTNRKLALQQNT